MKKSLSIIIPVVLVIAIVAGILIFVNLKENTKQDLGDLKEFVDGLYTDVTLELPKLETVKIDVTEEDMVKNFTALEDASVVEELVVSEPMMTSIAYSMVVLKVKDGTNVETVKTQMKDNLNLRKWLCVSAEKLYVNNSGNYIFAFMATDEYVKALYDQFKLKVDNKVGTLLEKEEEQMNLDDMSQDGQLPVTPIEPGVEVEVVQ